MTDPTDPTAEVQTRAIVIAYRCQACGVCSVNVTGACKCTDDDRKAAVEAERTAARESVDRALAAMTPDERSRWEHPIDPKYYRVVKT